MSQQTLPFEQFGPDFMGKAKELNKALDSRIPRVVGELLVDGFRESFDLQRFNDAGSQPWEQVKRRIYGSPWYGFSLETKSYKVPKGARGAGGSKKNFSPRAATRNILLGKGSENLRGSIVLHTARAGRIVIASDQVHAKVHNEGLQAKIFGRKVFTMPKRQFMGNSGHLLNQGSALIAKEIKKIL